LRVFDANILNIKSYFKLIKINLVEIIFSFTIVSFFMALSPGPDNIFILSNTLYNGKKAGVFTVLGLVTGCLFHTTLVAFGISEIIRFNENIFFVIKLIGFAYMLFLAFKVFKNSYLVEIKKIQNTKVSNINNFFTGLFMNILNPKVYFFFFTFFPAFLFLDPIELNYLSQFYVLGLLFMLITLIVFTSIVFFSSYISKYLLKFKFFQIFMRWIQILIFLSIACLILFSV
jgi:threonine/homoserine/homoserine lactone efflux protein